MKKINKVLAIMFTGGALLSGIDTLVVIACGVFAAALPMFGAWEYATHAAVFIALVFAGIATYIVDIALHQLLVDVFKGFAAKHHLNHKKLYGYMLFLCIAMGGSSILITLYCRGFVAHTIVGAAKQQDAATATTLLQSNTNQQLAALDKNEASIKSARRTAVGKVGSSALRSLALKGNPWAISELARMQRIASATFDVQLSDISTQRTAITAGAANAQAAVANQIAAANTEAIAVNQSNQQAIMWLQMILAIGGTGVMFASAIGRALLFSGYGIGDDPFNGLSKKSSKPVKTVTSDMGDKVTSQPVQGVFPQLVADDNEPRHVTLKARPVVITETGPKSDTVTEQLLTEFDGVQVFESSGKISSVKMNGTDMDKTKLRQYVSVYSGRAESSAKPATRAVNADKAALFQRAYKELYG